MNTIEIGVQEWATEDLKVTKFRNGEDIPLVTDEQSWVNLKTAAYVISPYGNYLYNWYAVNNPRRLAPEGFHVPKDEEWGELGRNYLGFHAGEDMKSSPFYTPAWDGRNSSDFSALPGGFRDGNTGAFGDLGGYGSWWSSSPTLTIAWNRGLGSGNPIILRNHLNLERWQYFNLCFGFSVRCVRNRGPFDF